MTAETSTAPLGETSDQMTPEQILSQARALLEEALTLLDRADRNALTPADRQRVYGMIHGLAGTTGSVDLPQVAKAVNDLERTVAPWLRDSDKDRPQWKIPFKALAVAMVDAQTERLKEAS